MPIITCFRELWLWQEKRNMNLEILGHPGGVFEEEDIARITSGEDRIFLTSPMRNREKSLYLVNL